MQINNTYKRSKLLPSLLAFFLLFASISSVSAFVIIDVSDTSAVDHSQHQNMKMAFDDSDKTYNSCCSSCDLNGICDSYSCNIAAVAILASYKFSTKQTISPQFSFVYSEIAPASPELLFRPPKNLI